MVYSSVLRRHLLLLALLFGAVLCVHGTQVMHRPAAYKTTPKAVDTEKSPKVTTIQKRAANKVSVAYFTNWGIYGANFREHS